MSSPIAKTRHSGVDRALVAVHQKMSHSHRIGVLADELAGLLRLLPRRGAQLRLLDIGCGDMTLSDALISRLPDLDVACTDIHPCPDELRNADIRWARYSQFDGEHLSFDAESFDVALFSDVLHHVPSQRRARLLAEAGRVASSVLIKDHLEHGPISRQMLRAMDFVGNFGYGVEVPDRYFTESEFRALCSDVSMRVVQLRVGLRLYEHLPVVRSLLSPNWHFVALCCRHGAA